MIRILIIDDADITEALLQLERDIGGSFNSSVEIKALNPITFISGIDEAQEIKALLDRVASLAAQFWDVALIDLNLAEVEMEEAERLHLPLSIVEAFRQNNRAAIVILYSGTLAKHIPKLIDEDTKSAKQDAEQILKKIYQYGIVGFVPRDEISNYVNGWLDEPPWLLRVDRLLTSNARLIVNVEESEFKHKSFADLAASVRRQDKIGRRVAGLVAEYGVASLVDLNT